LIAADLLPYVYESGFHPTVFSLTGSPLPAIVTRFLVPTGLLASILVGAWAARSTDRLFRGLAAGLLLAVGVVELFQFVFYATLTLTLTAAFPGGFGLRFSPWTILGLAGGLLVIAAGTTCLVAGPARSTDR